jgi:hypothetical protein
MCCFFYFLLMVVESEEVSIAAVGTATVGGGVSSGVPITTVKTATSSPNKSAHTTDGPMNPPAVKRKSFQMRALVGRGISLTLLI